MGGGHHPDRFAVILLKHAIVISYAPRVVLALLQTWRDCYLWTAAASVIWAQFVQSSHTLAIAINMWSVGPSINYMLKYYMHLTKTCKWNLILNSLQHKLNIFVYLTPLWVHVANCLYQHDTPVWHCVIVLVLFWRYQLQLLGWILTK